MNQRPTAILFTFISIITLLIGCGMGSSGGGKDPLQAALVTIDADPGAMKIGDRTLVTVEMQNIDPNGVFLKLRYSDSLAYIERTSIFHVGDDIVGINPIEGPTTKPNWTYLIFYIPAESFGDDDYGKLTFQLRGLEIADEGAVQVDVDLHDPEKDPGDEFDSDQPLFGVEDSAEIEINRE